MNAVELVLGFDLCLPPGSSRDELTAAWRQVLSPLLRELAGRASAQVSLHLGGVVLDHLEAEQPEGVEQIRALAELGRLELLGGTYYGAVLPVLPERDALGQLRLSGRRQEQLLGARIQGARLAYGAWDPGLPRLLARAGIKFAVLPAGCLRAAGIAPETIRGYLVAEREGSVVALVPDHAAEDRVGPGLEISRVVGLLRRHAMRRAGAVAWMLDARELGLRPGSAELCWGRAGAWLPRFLALIDAQDHWIKLTSFASVLDRFRPDGLCYLTACMDPATAARLQEPNGSAAPGLAIPLPGGAPEPRRADVVRPWDAFLARYPEGNRLHKRTLAASSEVARMATAVRAAGHRPGSADLARRLERAVLLLYQAQSAAALTHDPWGGIHDGRLRHRTWAALLRAEAQVLLALGEARRLRVDRLDTDCDGEEDLAVSTPHLRLEIDPVRGGALVALEALGAGANLCNTLSRRREIATAALCPADDLPALVAPGVAGSAAAAAVFLHAPTIPIEDEDTDETPVDAEDEGRDGRPRGCVDRVGRASFLDHLLGAPATLEAFERGQYPEVGDFCGSEYQVLMAEPRPEEGCAVVSLARDGALVDGGVQRLVRVTKRFAVAAAVPRFDVRYEVSNRSPDPFDATFGVELNLNLDSDIGDGAFLEAGGEPVDLAAAAECADVRDLAWGDERRGVHVALQFSPPARLWHHPVQAPCDGLDGPTARYQGACLLLTWSMALWGQERRIIEVVVQIADGGG